MVSTKIKWCIPHAYYYSLPHTELQRYIFSLRHYARTYTRYKVSNKERQSVKLNVELKIEQHLVIPVIFIYSFSIVWNYSQYPIYFYYPNFVFTERRRGALLSIFDKFNIVASLLDAICAGCRNTAPGNFRMSFAQHRREYKHIAL